MSYQQQQGEEGEEEKQATVQLGESPESQQLEQQVLNTPQAKRKTRVLIWWLLWVIQCSEVLAVQLSQGYLIEYTPIEYSYYDFSYVSDNENICRTSVYLNLLRLTLIATILLIYTPIKIVLARFIYVGVLAEILAITLTVVSLITSQQSVYISIIIPTLRITFQLCNITSAVFKYLYPSLSCFHQKFHIFHYLFLFVQPLSQEGGQHTNILLRGFLSLQFFIFMNSIWQGCSIFDIFSKALQQQLNIQITFFYLAMLLGIYAILFITRFYLRNKFDIVEPGEGIISKKNTNQQSDNIQSVSNQSDAHIQSILFINPYCSASPDKRIAWREILLSYSFAFLIIYLNANEPAFGQNFALVSVCYPGFFLTLLIILQIMVVIMTLEDTLNATIVFLVAFNSLNLFLFSNYPDSDFIWVFQTIIGALASCKQILLNPFFGGFFAFLFFYCFFFDLGIPLLVANYFDQNTTAKQFQHQCFTSLAFFALSNFTQFLYFSDYSSNPAAYNIVSVVCNAVSIPVIYFLRHVMKIIKPSYQEFQPF